MKAMLLNRTVSLKHNVNPFVIADIPEPEPLENEILIRVSVCGVCHTEIDEIEGRTPPPGLPIVPGHQVIGRVERAGKNWDKSVIPDIMKKYADIHIVDHFKIKE